MEKLCSGCLKKEFINNNNNNFLSKNNMRQKKQCLKKLDVVDWLSNIQTPFNFRRDDDNDNIVEVQFKNDRKEFFHNKEKIILSKGDFVTVESKSGGYDVGRVTITGELVKLQIRNKNIPLNSLTKKIYRKSTDKEIEIWNSLKKKEDIRLIQSRKIAKNLNISMKICDIEYQGDGKKATFYYTSENRIDFRKLIKKLALTFRIRIEMRQIGYRQEAAKIGGIGSCGRELCCSTWLKSFKSVNTNSARYQQLSIKIEKLTGQCNKLKCCLNYELETYLLSIKDFPEINNSKIYTEKGVAQCMKIDVFKKTMWYSYIKNPNTWFRIEVKKIKDILKNRNNQIAPSLEKLSTINAIHKTELTYSI
ncbi:PSP1 domain-containing protein [Blattabacterium cuenoti]|uniref:PSP1 domain-containing protein n=1 Tax=Blattabacterium cuenoti TaxID=1653831 RepID=UPI00163B8A32|nr:regulatory iron-sulfur-containing complex subunit RicT [Blattabacterium cuenoti]